LRFLFGDHVLDTARCELSRGGEQIAVEPQVFDLLVYLLRIASVSSARTICWGRCGAGGSSRMRRSAAGSQRRGAQSATAALSKP
jgi:hypothetical protein